MTIREENIFSGFSETMRMFILTQLDIIKDAGTHHVVNSFKANSSKWTPESLLLHIVLCMCADGDEALPLHKTSANSALPVEMSP